MIREAESGELANGPAMGGEARQASYFPHTCSGAARAGLQSLAGAVACEMRRMHTAARLTLSGNDLFRAALKEDSQYKLACLLAR